MNCPNCNIDAFDDDCLDDSSVIIGSGLISIQIQCSSCHAIWHGEVEFDFDVLTINLAFVEENPVRLDKEDGGV